MKCPYCEKEAKPRGLKNHVRLSSGDGHGEKGEIPEDYEGGVSDSDDGGNNPVPDSPNDEDSDDGDSGPSEASEAAEVTADDLTAPEPKESDTGESEASDSLPFDPNDDGAIRLDGDEQIYVRHGGEVVQATPDEGDYLLMTDDGPVLWDSDTDDRYEVVTA